VKILDFGLARLDDGSNIGQINTVARTSPGMIIGTVAYLSPEQARGETADHRSDIFAFGAVLFEMLTGRPAFLRPTTAETIVAVLRDSAKPQSESGRLPAEVEEILQHCLEKNRDERFRSACDLAFALRLAARTTATGPQEITRQTPKPSDSAIRADELSIAVSRSAT